MPNAYRALLAQGKTFKHGGPLEKDPSVSTSELEDWISNFVNPRRKAYVDKNGIGHVYVDGVISQRPSRIEKALGFVDVTDIANELEEIALDSKKILIHFDSPGGGILGVPELATKIVTLGDRIPIYAHTDSLMASAAYYLAGGAWEIYASPSAMVGSIGVYIPWVDYEGFYDQMGLRWNPVVNEEGIYKTAGAGPVLTDDERESLQDMVDKSFSNFVKHITAYRDIDATAMRGQVLSGEDAVRTGLVNGIMTESELIKKLAS
jgi:signal peptide peptidase SppA